MFYAQFRSRPAQSDQRENRRQPSAGTRLPSNRLSGVTYPELFAEMLKRRAFQAAFAMFGRMANALSVGMDADLECLTISDRKQLHATLTEGQRQLTEMWRYSMRGKRLLQPSDRTAETDLFRNVMELCVKTHADKSDQNRCCFVEVVGGMPIFERLQETPFDSAKQWMMCY